jgi:hypothetical protein
MKVCTWNVGEAERPALRERPDVPRSSLDGGTVPAVFDDAGAPALLVLSADRQSLRMLTCKGGAWVSSSLIRARSEIQTVAVSSAGTRIAWRDAEGEVGVYSLERSQVLLRLNVTNAAEPVP